MQHMDTAIVSPGLSVIVEHAVFPALPYVMTAQRNKHTNTVSSPIARRLRSLPWKAYTGILAGHGVAAHAPLLRPGGFAHATA